MITIIITNNETSGKQWGKDSYWRELRKSLHLCKLRQPVQMKFEYLEFKSQHL